MTGERMTRARERVVIENALIDCEIAEADARERLAENAQNLRTLAVRRADLARQLERLQKGPRPRRSSDEP